MVYSEDVEIVRELVYKKSVDLYDLHLKYRLSPAQVSRSVKNFLEEGIIRYEGELISLTEVGKEWIIRNRKALFLDEERKYWKNEAADTSYKEIDFYPLELFSDIKKIIEEDEE